jgi:hypothetical protein
MSNESPASILFNELGQPVGVMFDGYVYRLQVQTTIDDGYSHGPVAVKGPNQAATVVDPALVVAISPNNSFTVNATKPSVTITTSVAASVTSVTLLSSNSTRLGATIYNDSMSFLYVKLGAAASTSSFEIKLFPLSYYEVPYGYTGQIDGIWADSSGFARIGELTP